MTNNRPYLLTFLFLSLFFACEDKPERTTDTTDSLEANVYSYETKDPLPDVRVEVQNGGVTTPVDTTDNQGECNLNNISSQNKYIFNKIGYESYQLYFLDYNNLKRIDLYLNDQPVGTDSVNLRGYAFNGEGTAIPDVQVSLSNGSYSHATVSGKDGFYSLDAPYNDTYNSYMVSFTKGSTSAEINLLVVTDTTETSLYVDGFSVQSDTLAVK